VHAQKSSLYWAVSDVMTMAKRNLIALVRIPSAVVFAVIQPVMFVLLFRYVFGGAIHPKGISYVNYLIPGILVQTTIFGSVGTAIGLAEDLHKGLIERFRALPMARTAVLAGRTVSDLARNLLVIVIITLVGFGVGFRPNNGVPLYLVGCLLMLAFSYCLSWGFAYVGLAAPNSETAQAMSFPLIFPLTFASGIFVPINQMPSWLQGFATYQPVSEATRAVRGLMINSAFTQPGNSVLVTLIWAAGAVAVLGPLATWQYRRAT
jgi:ABC-2 type transport system permease protein/oleandomycin transport system permease protein